MIVVRQTQSAPDEGLGAFAVAFLQATERPSPAGCSPLPARLR
jgi:hypothetical protein